MLNIACIWASAGFDIQVRDPSSEQRAACTAYVEENVALYAEKTGKAHGKVNALEHLSEAVSNAWLIIEAVPEKLPLKIDTFAELDRLAPTDCILASNSSSYKSSEMLDKVREETKSRILNMHYYMPPQVMVVELMTNGFTDPAIFDFLVDRSREAATIPYVARKESTGFIFNRLWAAVKREVLTILAEEVSVPEEIDSMWTEMFIKGGVVPCKTMDSMYKSFRIFSLSLYLLKHSCPLNIMGMINLTMVLVQTWALILSLLSKAITLPSVVFRRTRQSTSCRQNTWTTASLEQSVPREGSIHLRR